MCKYPHLVCVDNAGSIPHFQQCHLLSISNVGNGNKMDTQRTTKAENKRSGRALCHWGPLWGLTLSGDVQLANRSKFIDLERFS